MTPNGLPPWPMMRSWSVSPPRWPVSWAAASESRQRLFLRKLVDVLDKIEQFPDFDPYNDYEVKIAPTELSDAERAALSAEDVQLDL